MRTVVFLEAPDSLFRVVDPDSFEESEFCDSVLEALIRVYPNYQAFPFTGTFRHEGRGYRPDLALVARDLSHWFVIEVELVSHSLEGHVLPQVRGFEYGDPQDDCLTILVRELALPRDQVRTLLARVPRGTVVVANRWGRDWEPVLRSHKVQMLVATTYCTDSRARAIELDGVLHVTRQHLGFGRYSAADKSLVFPRAIQLPRGPIQFRDSRGAVSDWIVVETDSRLWVTKEKGSPDIRDGAYMQVLRAFDGGLWLQDG